MKNFRRIFVILFLALLSVSLFALPGVDETFQTESGQYVYYRDYRLENPLYIGFLYYGEDMIQVRYLLTPLVGYQIHANLRNFLLIFS